MPKTEHNMPVVKQSYIFLAFFFMISLVHAGNKSGNPGTSPEARPSISGKVIDKDTQEELVCANVEVINKNIHTCTDIHGNFTISDLEPGTYTLKIHYISYQEAHIRKIHIRKNRPETLQVALEPIHF